MPGAVGPPMPYCAPPADAWYGPAPGCCMPGAAGGCDIAAGSCAGPLDGSWPRTRGGPPAAPFHPGIPPGPCPFPAAAPAPGAAAGSDRPDRPAGPRRCRVSAADPLTRSRPVRAGFECASTGVSGTERPRQRGEQQCDREFVPLLGQIGDVIPGHDDLEDAAIDFPVPELGGSPLVHAQVDDVQPIAEIVEHEARLTVIRPDGPRFPQPVEFVKPHLLAPDAARCRGEAMLFRWRRGREQRHVTIRWANCGLIRSTEVRGHKPVPHEPHPSLGRCQASPSYRATGSSPASASRHSVVPTGIWIGSR